MLRTDHAVDGAKVHYQSIEIAGGNPRSIERREGLIGHDISTTTTRRQASFLNV